MSFAQTDDGALTIGTTRKLVGFDRENPLESVLFMARRAVRFFPRLKDVHIIRCFADLRPYTPVGMPLIGEFRQPRGLYIAAGHEGDGIALAPATGKFLSEEIADGKASFSLEPFSPDRFAAK